MSELHDQLADALVEVLEGIDVRTYKWSVGAIKPPCAVIELPTFRRTEPDGAEDHVGADDWPLDFPVVFYVELKKPAPAQAQLASSVEAWIKAIDNLTPDSDGFVLNSLCLDAKVVESTPFVQPDETRNLIGYETHVSLVSFQ